MDPVILSSERVKQSVQLSSHYLSSIQYATCWRSAPTSAGQAEEASRALALSWMKREGSGYRGWCCVCTRAASSAAPRPAWHHSLSENTCHITSLAESGNPLKKGHVMGNDRSGNERENECDPRLSLSLCSCSTSLLTGLFLSSTAWFCAEQSYHFVSE